MKKLLTLGVLTAMTVALSGQQASAWTNIKFGIGANLQWQSGDTNFLWGLWRNGQVPPPPGAPVGPPPGADLGGAPFGGPGYPPPGLGYPPPGVGYPGGVSVNPLVPGSFPEVGQNPNGQAPANANVPGPVTPGAAAQAAPSTTRRMEHQTPWSGNAAYQPVAYTQPTYNAGYYQPSPYQNYQPVRQQPTSQAPSYWYGN